MIRPLIFLFCLTVAAPCAAQADAVSAAFDELRGCIMANDAAGCRALLTPNSYSLYDRFASYGLMTCLPTSFTVESEKKTAQGAVVTASMPAGEKRKYLIHLAYDTSTPTPRLDLPASLRMGLGVKWENKVTLAEQLYLMMKENLGDKLTCDKLEPLLK